MMLLRWLSPFGMALATFVLTVWLLDSLVSAESKTGSVNVSDAIHSSSDHVQHGKATEPKGHRRMQVRTFSVPAATTFRQRVIAEHGMRGVLTWREINIATRELYEAAIRRGLQASPPRLAIDCLEQETGEPVFRHTVHIVVTEDQVSVTAGQVTGAGLSRFESDCLQDFFLGVATREVPRGEALVPFEIEREQETPFLVRRGLSEVERAMFIEELATSIAAGRW